MNSLKWLALVACLVLVACQPPKRSKSEGSRTGGDGSSTGGGSFGDESSLTILRWAANDLSAQIKNSSPEIYRSLPAGWTQERLANVIANVEPLPAQQESHKVPEVSRYGQRLMFNYGNKSDGTPFITATRLFMDSYSSYDVNSRPRQDFYYTLEEVKLKLAHEAAHLLGLGLSKETDMPQARQFAKALLESLDSDNVECINKSALPTESFTAFRARGVSEDTLKGWKRAYVFNRPTGKAAVPLGTGEADGDITVFAPRSYEEKFDVTAIEDSVLKGVRKYGFKEGHFSWSLVDLRKAVSTENGFKSNYKYEQQADMNNHFSEYMDFKVLHSSNTSLLLESYPPLEQENWEFYRSQGKSQIALQMENGKITDAKVIILKAYNRWLGPEDTAPNETHIEVPLTCVRSFKPLAPGR